jgi:hypothetical protein
MAFYAVDVRDRVIQRVRTQYVTRRQGPERKDDDYFAGVADVSSTSRQPLLK